MGEQMPFGGGEQVPFGGEYFVDMAGNYDLTATPSSVTITGYDSAGKPNELETDPE